MYVARADRLWKPPLRAEGHAAGLQLPVPSRRAEYGFQGHRMAFAASAGSRLACVGAGASSWHFNAGGEFDEDHARHSCLCGGRFPSCPHLPHAPQAALRGNVRVARAWAQWAGPFGRSERSLASRPSWCLTSRDRPRKAGVLRHSGEVLFAAVAGFRGMGSISGFAAAQRNTTESSGPGVRQRPVRRESLGRVLQVVRALPR